MTSEWHEVCLGYVADLITGYPFKSQHYTDIVDAPRLIGGDNIAQGSLRWENVRRWPRDMADGLDDYWLEPGDVVLAMDRPWIEAGLKRAAVGPQDVPSLLIQRTARLRGTAKLDTAFLRYVVGNQAFTQYILSVQTGTAVPHISPEQIRAFRFSLPPLEEQRAIAEILGSLDDRIDNLRQTSTTMEAIATALFKSWFVDFDGVSAEDMRESELGLIPKGWRVGALAELCELNASKWTDKKHPLTVRYIDLSGVSSNRIETVKEFLFNEAPSRARLHLREGDTIVGTVRPGNRAFAYIHAPDANLTGSTGFAVLSPRQPHFSSFVYLAATRDEAIGRLANLADGAAYPAVRPNIVTETPCVIAPDDMLAEFSGITKPLLERIVQSLQQAVTLAALRDTLLPRLISGQLRVTQ